MNWLTTVYVYQSNSMKLVMLDRSKIKVLVHLLTNQRPSFAALSRVKCITVQCTLLLTFLTTLSDKTPTVRTQNKL